jgi:hypothetical protein
MQPWQTQQKFDAICDEKACHGMFGGIGLMAHLETKGTKCVLHYGVLQYLRALYGRHNGCGHKFLFKMGDTRYKRAQEAEETELFRLVEIAETARRVAEEKERVAQAKLEKKHEALSLQRLVNRDQAEKIKELQEVKKKLGLEEETKPRKKMTPKEISKYDKLLKDYLFSIASCRKKTQKTQKLLVPQQMDVTAFMDKHYISETSILFPPDEKSKFTTNDYMCEWDVQFDGKCSISGSA